ncbi:MAG: DUF4382 domain-containing protein [Thioalkalispiraceae bacterium]|jgi:hypothetical protein
MLGMKLKQLILLLFLSVSLLSACGGGGSESSQQDEGQVLISLTDAEGNFVTYTVDVLSIRLTRQDGTEVETLPLNTRVDFAQYTEMTEFLTAASVPRGIYVKGSVILDYTNADIQVEDAMGASTPVAQILDASGNPVTTLEVNINLAGRSELPIAPGIPKNLMLDFDLEQSHVVSLAEPVTITVDPLFIAEVDPQAPRIHRTRGPLRQVDVANSSFEIYIRPFYHRIRTGQRLFGSLQVLTNEETIFEIDGISYQGNDGLMVLDNKVQFTAVIARGDLKFNPLRFEANEVYAGSSVPGGDLDVVRGTVTSRTVDDKIIVQGATLFRTDGTIVFNDYVTIQLDASTTVAKQLEVGNFTIDDISVGQRISVFGMITNDQLSDLQMSAVNGFARMRISSVNGEVISLPDELNYLSLNLNSINGRNISIYDFTGTGIDAGNDADPAQYEVDTGSLSLANITVDDPVIVRGFPTAFATAPADFTARTVMTSE